MTDYTQGEKDILTDLYGRLEYKDVLHLMKVLSLKRKEFEEEARLNHGAISDWEKRRKIGAQSIDNIIERFGKVIVKDPYFIRKYS